MKYLEYKENRKQGTDSFPVAYYHLTPDSPRYEMPYHWHTEQEIIRINKGKFTLLLDGVTYELKAGDVVYIQDGISHGGMPEDCIYECLVFDLKVLQKSEDKANSFIKQIFRHEITVIPGLCDNNANQKLSFILDLLFSSMYTNNVNELNVVGALLLLYGYIFEMRLYSVTMSVNSVSKANSAKFKKALDFIESHFLEEISLEDMANAAGMSPKYFCRFFREMTGRTPLNYLNYYRIEYACEQLSTKNMSVTEAALSSGFNDISYFIKTFKKQKGTTPKHYTLREL